MKYKILFLLIVVLGISGFLIFGTSNKEQSSESCPQVKPITQSVIMKADSFQPETLTVKKCTKVTFKNQDKIPRWPASNLHPTHGIYPEFDPLEPVEVGKEWSFVFDKVGSWKYHDHLLPSIRGTIVVSE